MSPIPRNDVFLTITIMSTAFLIEVALFIFIGMF
jgi:hypothetical protein